MTEVSRKWHISADGILKYYEETRGPLNLEIKLDGSSYNVSISENGKMYRSIVTKEELEKSSLFEKERLLHLANKLEIEASKLREEASELMKKSMNTPDFNLDDFVNMIKAKNTTSSSP